MPTFRYAKLVRNKIADWHVQAGHTPIAKKLKGDELKNALVNKLHEEADEVNGALSKADLTEEIADVQQVIDDICQTCKIDKSEVLKSQKTKAAKKGSFSDGVFIDTVMIPDENDEWAKYCRTQPDKYPEVTI